jgi:hypothetical protein
MFAYARGGGAVPVADGEQADTNGDGSPNFRAIEGQTSRQMIRHPGQYSEVKQQDKDKNAQFDQARSKIGEYFCFALIAK